MKKTLLSLCGLVAATQAFAQTTPEAGDDFFGHINSHHASEQTEATIDRRRIQLGALLDDIAAAEATSPGTPMHRLANFYRAEFDLNAMDARGIAPISADLATIAALETPEDVARFMARPYSHSLFGYGIYPDLREPSVNRLYLDMMDYKVGVLGLPDRSFYLEPDNDNRAALAAYSDYIEITLNAVGWSAESIDANAIVGLETRIAQAMWTPEQLRDRDAMYNAMTIAELEAYAPGYPWRDFLSAAGVEEIDYLILGTDDAVAKSARLFDETPLETWKAWLAFHWVDNHAQWLPEGFRDRHFAFHERALKGNDTRRDAKAAARLNTQIEMSRDFGRLYAERHFPPAEKARMNVLIERLRGAFAERLAVAPWMTDEERAEAGRKIEGMTVYVGYPDVYRDLSALEMRSDDPIGNRHRLRQAERQHDASLLGKAWPDGEWVWGAPHWHDAANTAQLNMLTFPAAILQSNYEPDDTPAEYFSSLGLIIGHEMGHGFDDQGVNFDHTGRMQGWWSDATAARYSKEAAKLIAQISSYEVLPGVSLTGERMVGEAMADLIGAEMALAAYHDYCAASSSGDCPEGVTAQSRAFFTALAESNDEPPSEEQLQQIARNGYHPPMKWRVNGTVRNMDAWYDAFGIAQGDALYLAPEERVQLWQKAEPAE